MAERSLFYGVSLEGPGSWEVESLRSFIERLAVAHSFKPRGLINTLLEALPLGNASINIEHLLRAWDVHGYGQSGPLLMTRLEQATSASLAPSTLKRFEHVLSAVHLTRRRDSVYCAQCCAVRGEASPAYGRLLWEVQCVAACPRHGVTLRSTKVCGASAADRLALNHRPAMRGVCSDCGSIGFACIRSTPVVASDAHVWVAEQVGELLSLSESEVQALCSESLHAGLRAVIDGAFGGMVVPAAIESGLARATVLTWLKGTMRPALSMLVQLCLRAQASLVECLRGQYVVADAWCGNGLGPLEALAPRPYTRTLLTHEDIRRRLEYAIASEQPVSTRQLCDEMGVDTREARRRFPALMGTIARRSQVRNAMDDQRRYAVAFDLFRNAALELAAEGLPVTDKFVQARAKMAAFGMNPMRVKALADAIASVASDKSRLHPSA